VPASHAERLAKGVSGPVELLIVRSAAMPPLPEQPTRLAER